MADVERTQLPGIGTRRTFALADGARIGVVSHRGGDREILLYESGDPDTCQATMRLTGQEAGQLIELLQAGE